MGIQCTYKSLQCAFSEKGSFIHHKELCIECWNQQAFVLHTKTFSVSLPGTIYDTSWSVMGYDKLQVASDFGGGQNGGENIRGEPLLVQQAHVYFAHKYK